MSAVIFADYVTAACPLGRLTPRRIGAMERLARYKARRRARRAGFSVGEVEVWMVESSWVDDNVTVYATCRGEL